MGSLAWLQKMDSSSSISHITRNHPFIIIDFREFTNTRFSGEFLNMGPTDLTCRTDITTVMEVTTF